MDNESSTPSFILERNTSFISYYDENQDNIRFNEDVVKAPSFQNFVDGRDMSEICDSEYGGQGPPSQSAVRPPDQSSVYRVHYRTNMSQSSEYEYRSQLAPSLGAVQVHYQTSIYGSSHSEYGHQGPPSLSAVRPPGHSNVNEAHYQKSAVREEHTVKRWRLKTALTLPESTTIYEACRQMAVRKVDALLLLDSNGLLCGILTDRDITTRVVARELDIENTPVAKVTTRNPDFIDMDTLAVEALQKMVLGKFRHLPVVENGEVVGILDIANCLYDIIAQMDRAADTTADIEGVRKHWGTTALSTIISENLKLVTVSPSDTVLMAAKEMLECGINCAIVTVDSKPQGILTSKDILMRVIAHGLPPDLTLVEKVMTPYPQSTTIDTPIFEALHIMLDEKFVHLPVVDNDGNIVAITDVIQIAHAVVTSVSALSWGNDTETTRAGTRERIVKKLRLTKALIVIESTTIYEACRRMAARRVNVLLLTDSNGLLSGILTDKDIITRVVTCELDIERTLVSEVMKKNPVFVTFDTLVVEALQKMVQGKFRHLIVVENGEVVAILDIAKCLYDAIALMERAAENGKAIAAAIEGVENNWGTSASGSGSFVETLRERLFKPSLSTIISENSKLVTVSPSDTVLMAAKVMLECGINSAIVTVDSKPHGILTSKDILMRVIAQGLPPDSTLVEKVMTPKPECATMDTVIVEALHIMHDGKFLHLPVVDKVGNVVAIIDVAQVVHAALAMVGSTTGIDNDAASAMMPKFSDPAMAASPANNDSETRRAVTRERPVKKLRLTKALIVIESTTINEACRRMAARRVNTLLLTDSNGLLCGILTDKDITTRVVACELDIENTPVSTVMTKNPVFVTSYTLVVEALQKMVQGKFRHLPVVEYGEVVAILDIAKCLYDAIALLDRDSEKGKAIVAAIEGVEKSWGRTSASGSFVETLRERLFKPSLSTIISENSMLVTVSPSDTVLMAAKVMLECDINSAIVTVDSKPHGILTSKDILMQVIAQGLPPDLTLVEKVMTPKPECATMDTAIVDALHIMHDGKFLDLPVVDKDGNVVAITDVLHITRAAVASGGSTASSMMQKFWDFAMAAPTADDDSEHGSEGSFDMASEEETDIEKWIKIASS